MDDAEAGKAAVDMLIQFLERRAEFHWEGVAQSLAKYGKPNLVAVPFDCPICRRPHDREPWSLYLSNERDVLFGVCWECEILLVRPRTREEQQRDHTRQPIRDTTGLSSHLATGLLAYGFRSHDEVRALLATPAVVS